MELVRKQLTGYRVLQSKVQQFEQQTDLIIPDVNPDAMTMLAAWGECIVTEQTLRRDRITAGGTVTFTLLYRPESGNNSVSLKGSLNFQEVLELKEIKEDDLLFLRAEIMELRGIILNSRKVGVQCRVAMWAWVYQRENMLLTEGVQAKPEEGIQLKLQRQRVNLLAAAFEKNLSVNEDVRLAEVGLQDQLLCSTIWWKPEDVRTLNKKIMVRGSAQVRILLLCEGDTLRELEYALPFSQIVESSEIKLDSNAEIRYITTQQQLRMERREDGVFLVCNLGAKSVIEIYREVETTALTDVYSTRHHTTVGYAPTPICGCKTSVLSGKVQQTINLESQPTRVLQCQCNGSAAEVTGEKIRSAFCVTVFWEDHEGYRQQHTVVLREEQEGNGYCSGAVIVKVCEIATVVTGNAISVELQVQYTLRQVSGSQMQQVEACEADLARPRKSYAPGTLLLRTVCAGESTWELAKDYGTTESAILTANHFAPDEKPMENQLVMIPFLRN